MEGNIVTLKEHKLFGAERITHLVKKIMEHRKYIPQKGMITTLFKGIISLTKMTSKLGLNSLRTK